MKFSFIIIGLLLTIHVYGQQPPIDGEFRESYPNGQLKIKGFYKNGKADSVWTFYFSDGKIYKTGTYKDCQYDLGHIKILRSVIDDEWHEKGIENGNWKIYHPNGVLKTEYQSICGTETGMAKTFDESGRLEKESFYSNGKLQFERELYENGITAKYVTYSYYSVKEKHDKYLTEYSKATVSVFYDTGELEELYYEDRYDLQGEYKKYWKNGFLQFEANYDKGDENGVVKEYYDNGFRESETEYKKGKKHGKSFLNSRDGRVIKKQTWSNGVLKKEE